MHALPHQKISYLYPSLETHRRQLTLAAPKNVTDPGTTLSIVYSFELHGSESKNMLSKPIVAKARTRFEMHASVLSTPNIININQMCKPIPIVALELEKSGWMMQYLIPSSVTVGAHMRTGALGPAIHLKRETTTTRPGYQTSAAKRR